MSVISTDPSKFELDSKFCEFVGAVIGDGNIYKKDRKYNRKYLIGITGDKTLDAAYFDYLSNVIFGFLGRRPRIKVRRNGGLYLKIQSKPLVNFIVNEIGIPVGEGKCYNVHVPKSFIGWNRTRYMIRCVMDTDGSVFVSDKPGSPGYPSLEITTTSSLLAMGIFEILSKRKFRVRLRSFVDKRYGTRTFKVSLNGWNMLEKWYNEIGFSNPEKLKKAVSIINKRNGGT
ncbi:MAG: hypothetical protein NT016_00115 [Candidatus Aenigmarchaeota archaeon]|nr:hypothetical protein [Candidatus Aenigmarchaeota archaeon]